MQTQTEMQREVDEAVRTMRAGGIILYPTDTVWGLGCDATSSAAVERIYRLKRSGNKKSMLVLCASADMIVRYVNKAPGIAFEVMELATSPLTAILPGAAGLAENLIPDEGTLGVRIPDHEFCRRMLRAQHLFVELHLAHVEIHLLRDVVHVLKGVHVGEPFLNRGFERARHLIRG